MNHRRKAICRICGTQVVYHGHPYNQWSHTELELAHTAGHSPQPQEIVVVSPSGDFETQGASA